jgi:hypothetical protein
MSGFSPFSEERAVVANALCCRKQTLVSQRRSWRIYVSSRFLNATHFSVAVIRKMGEGAKGKLIKAAMIPELPSS